MPRNLLFRVCSEPVNPTGFEESEPIRILHFVYWANAKVFPIETSLRRFAHDRHNVCSGVLTLPKELSFKLLAKRATIDFIIGGEGCTGRPVFIRLFFSVAVKAGFFHFFCNISKQKIFSTYRLGQIIFFSQKQDHIIFSKSLAPPQIMKWPLPNYCDHAHRWKRLTTNPSTKDALSWMRCKYYYAHHSRSTSIEGASYYMKPHL